MLISLDWLRRYVPVEASVEDVAHALTMAGFPVVATERLETGDVRLDVEITSNRPDLQCHLGIAREVAGLCGGAVTLPDVVLPPESSDRIDVHVDDADLCPWYSARVVRGVRVGPSPEWLRRALEAAGQRSVNNVVDVTNFVLLECGHPLHAFDLARLDGPRLGARRAPGASFRTLDGSQLVLGADDCAITDAAAPVALGGIMGGLDSEVGTTTTDIALECALFAPLAIRAASRRHQLRTESSFRFERFVDPALARWASDRACALLVEGCGATGVGPLCEAGPGVPEHVATVALRTAQVGRVLGVPVDVATIRRILVGLGLVETAATDAGTTWSVPTWRPDLCDEIDLIEEVARVHGFAHVPDAVTIPVRPQVVDEGARARRRLRDALVAAGLRECCTAPFVGEGPDDIALLRDVPALRVENPMRAEESLLRRSVLGPLLRVAKGNQDRGVPEVRFFETAPAYLRGAADAPDELLLTGIVITGSYADAKGAVEALLAAVGLDGRVSHTRGAPAPLRRDRAATLHLAQEVVGHVGELSDRALRDFGLERGVAVAELRTDVLAAHAALEQPYRTVSRFPAVQRDLAIVLEDAVLWQDMARVVRDAAGALLTDLRPLNVFRSEDVGAGRKSVALRMELRSPERTLTGEEADACVRSVVAAFESELGGRLRA